MLLEFKTENFKSFLDEMDFLMTLLAIKYLSILFAVILLLTLATPLLLLIFLLLH